MKTNIYIDGYNLYYGCLKYSPYKWLDLNQLFMDQILRAQTPTATINKIKFFTADIKANFSSQGQASQQAQERYHRALQALYPEQIEIIKGYYSVEKAKLPLYLKPVDTEQRIEVWRLEEKQTDVNLAMHGYRDVIHNECEQLLVVSNDTDLEMMLQMIREERGDTIQIGVVIPARRRSGEKQRPPNDRLSRYADWTRHYIRDEELERSQLPDKIPTRKKPILKPSHW